MDKIQSWEEAQNTVAKWKGKKHTTVFTNGCFDILHAGHVSYLKKAKELGHKLILGLNSDQSVQRMQKSPNRPLQSETSRSIVMAGLESVDLVVVFNEDTPLELIKALKPDVLVKGADYKIEDIVGGKEVLSWGGSVETIEFLDGYSTTAIEQKILNHKS